MTYTISKDFTFAASHQLTHLPDTHKCSRLHGHNYLVRVRLARGLLDGNGFVIDYGDLAPFADYLGEHFDHRHLNVVLSDDQVTAERLAEHLYRWCDDEGWPVEAVGVSETPKTWAWYSE